MNLPRLFLISLGLAILQPGLAQPSADMVSAFVEALRRAAPDTGREDDGLYSEWQIKPDNIRRWSERCTGVAMTVEQFEANPVEARSVLECKMSEVLEEQYQIGQDELTAVQRAAAWWMTGDPDQYASEGAGRYVTLVVEHYQDIRQ